MIVAHPLMLTNFFVAGINYKKSDGEMRGRFAINTDQYSKIINSAPDYGVDSFFILSTCNRTEIYGFADNPDCLTELLCSQTTGDKRTFTQLAYVKNGRDAAEHLFKVGAGLDSQILGDYEIIGQLKKAIKFSSDNGFINPFMQRLSDHVLQASKLIKNSTDLSSGSVSVSFTAVQYLKQHISSNSKHKILVIGAGKIGRNTCKNLVDYFGEADITLINRSMDRAAVLAAELDLNYASMDDLSAYLNISDIILVATSALQPLVSAKDFQGTEKKLILDLSIPYNVDPAVSALPNVTLINVDELSKATDENLQKRRSELPKALAIIRDCMADFLDWYEMHKISPVLKAVKTTLSDIYRQQLAVTKKTDKAVSYKYETKVQAVVKNMACKIKHDKNYGCHSLEAINEFMRAVAN
ncbi:glutamyl-tRNA reductase [Mucilaginibacter sp. L3T2-6]|uniref:glutamyl-tRNA reductase n=1 Tax=Mucilaginibacter sp. L3T2-6 TaxID=3062491 RepID=UPI00267694BB|nr:glutamyl-tRNA reductase [Mucilaginibacter sp. L3T2-6]MDO3642195.1 glutamyl-tRNA reductase [Mucilaginibacter sp. L3T2-6]MDV6214690.1 glutamyl-tRNA reductase [Mucilaginibacter sp. L3T2-6]